MLDLLKGPVCVLGGERLVHGVEELSKVKMCAHSEGKSKVYQ